jgi:hypothetical protein
MNHGQQSSTKSPGAILDDAQRRARRAWDQDGPSNPTLSAIANAPMIRRSASDLLPGGQQPLSAASSQRMHRECRIHTAAGGK